MPPMLLKGAVDVWAEAVSDPRRRRPEGKKRVGNAGRIRGKGKGTGGEAVGP